MKLPKINLPRAIWQFLKSLRELENRYTFMVQVDYIMGLCTATMLGMMLMDASYRPPFTCSLVVSLALGSYTVKLGIRVWKGIVKDGQKRLESP